MDAASTGEAVVEPRACIPFSGHQEVKTVCVKDILLVGLSRHF